MKLADEMHLLLGNGEAVSAFPNLLHERERRVSVSVPPDEKLSCRRDDEVIPTTGEFFGSPDTILGVKEGASAEQDMGRIVGFWPNYQISYEEGAQ